MQLTERQAPTRQAGIHQRVAETEHAGRLSRRPKAIPQNCQMCWQRRRAASPEGQQWWRLWFVRLSLRAT
jgi:hypothetical protein